MVRLLFIILAILAALQSPAIALFCGIVFALIFKNPYLKQSRKLSKYLLQAAVVGLGFGMNLHQSLAAGREGMLFTIGSVVGVLTCGWFIGHWVKLSPKLSYLISSGTAICGGSAIAAVAPIVKANEDETSLSLGTIFILNAIALFIFPLIGHALGLSQEQFGLWSAIAIQDTSSVVGAASSYGTKALEIATTVKLTRALWIIPLSLLSVFFFRNDKCKISIPWFILLFILAMVANTYITIPQETQSTISTLSHNMLSLTLFLIGSTLSPKTIKSVGSKPIVLGVSLWVLISVVSLLIIL